MSAKVSGESQGDGKSLTLWREPGRDLSAGTRHQPDLLSASSMGLPPFLCNAQLDGRW